MPKYARLLLLFIVFPLLAACTAHRTSYASAVHIPDYYASASGFSAQVAATVNRGATENDFTLAWTVSPAGSVIEVLKPKSVAGIRAEITPDARTLVYDGAALTLPDSVSPIELLPILAAAWQGAYSECTPGAADVTLVYFETLGDHAYELHTRFDTATLKPLDAAVFQDGTRVAVYTFETFTFSS